MLDPFVILSPILLLPVVWLLRFIGCSSFSVGTAPAATTPPAGPPQAGPPPAATVTVKITPPSATVMEGQVQPFKAPVTGATDQTVLWSSDSPGASFTYTIDGVDFKFLGPRVPGIDSVKVIATSKASPGASDVATVTLARNGARFLKFDKPTQGAWSGVYGSAGWALAYSPAIIVKPPSYFPGLQAALAPWPVGPVDEPLTDPRGVQKPVIPGQPPPPDAIRFAAAWYSTGTLELEFDVGDQPRQVAIYCVDWDATPTRAQTFEMWDNSLTVPSAAASIWSGRLSGKSSSRSP